MMTQPVARLRLHCLNHPPGLFPGLRFGGDTHIDGVVLGIGGKGGILAAHQRAQSLLNDGLAQTSHPQNARKDQAAQIMSQPGYDLLFPHAIHLSWHARHGNNDMLIFLNPPTGRGPNGVGQTLGGWNETCLLEIALRHGRSHMGKASAQGSLQIRINLHGLPQQSADALARKIILCRTQSSRHDDKIRALPCSLQRLHNTPQVIADLGDEIEVNA